jgi:hypothetical protein
MAFEAKEAIFSKPRQVDVLSAQGRTVAEAILGRHRRYPEIRGF